MVLTNIPIDLFDSIEIQLQLSQLDSIAETVSRKHLQIVVTQVQLENVDRQFGNLG